MDYRELYAGLSRDMLLSKAVYFAEHSDMLEEENRKLREVIKELEQSNKVLTSKVNGAEEVIEGLEKELAQTRAELDNRVKNLRERIESKNGLIGTLKAKLDNARNTIEALKSRNNDNHEIAADLELNNRKLQVRIQELEKQLKQAAELGDACMDKIRDLEKKNAKVIEDRRILSIELGRTQRSHRKERDDLIEAYETARKEISNRGKDIGDLADELEQTRAELRRRDEEIADLKIVINSLRFHIRNGLTSAKPVTPKDLWTAGETVAEGFAAGVKAKKPEEPICKSVPCSTVIGKLAHYFRDANDRVLGKDIDIRDLMMPDSLHKLVEELAAECDQKIMEACVKDYDSVAKHIKNKYDALRKVGFTDDQAISLLPLWWDDEDYV